MYILVINLFKTKLFDLFLQHNNNQLHSKELEPESSYGTNRSIVLIFLLTFSTSLNFIAFFSYDLVFKLFHKTMQLNYFSKAFMY